MKAQQSDSVRAAEPERQRQAVGEEVVDLAAPQRARADREIDEAPPLGLGEEIGDIGLVGRVADDADAAAGDDAGGRRRQVAPLRAAKRAGMRW